MDNSIQVVSEAVNSIRTILTLGNEVILERHQKLLNKSYEDTIKDSNIGGIFFGLSYMLFFIVTAVIFYLASIFTTRNNLDLQDVFATVFIVIFAGISTGNAINYVPDIEATKEATRHVFSIIDSQD